MPETSACALRPGPTYVVGPGPRPHDLLRLARPEQLVPAPCGEQSPPAWVHACLERTPWVVVRRAPRPRALVPVGVRGPRRGQRWAAYLPPEAVRETVRPEDLAAGAAPRDLPVFHAITDLAALSRPAWAPAWGPGGSAGFELATGHPAAHEGSDLDLVVRVPRPVPPAAVAGLLRTLSGLPVRVDVQLQSPWGGFAAAEYARHTGEVLLRTDVGPCLVADPWHRPATARPEPR
ncbi:malonate decarboxylase holo-ACP synthase [Streptomyces sp. NPDC088554]|uniref:malonate decarboxylase holo-ACP synthase n=2 Tax=unclassified Streptomyces TaxID=2593676 RepID=UPI003814176C